MPEVDPEDTVLARESQAGSLRAFEQLVSRHHEKIFAFLLALTRHRQDAEDLTQETFLRAWKAIKRYDPSRPLSPWLMTIARRQSIAMLRKRKPLPEIEPEPITPPDSDSPSLRLWSMAERHLSRESYSALWLHYREELPLVEVGRIIGKREGTVKVMLHRARKTLANIAQGKSLGGPIDSPPQPPLSPPCQPEPSP